MPNIKRGMMGAAGGASGDGSLWAWGGGHNGKLGLGDTTNRSSPSQVGDLTDWIDVGAYFRGGLAVKADGTLWSWGDNAYGQLANGNTTGSSSPAQVGSLTNWFQVEGGEEHAIAIKTDGTLWAWGRNNEGQLGVGDTTDRCSPVQVGSLTDWKGMSSDNLTAGTPIKISVGFDTNLVIKDDGTLWTWGNGNYGQLGTGSITDTSSPVQVGSLTNWASIQGPSAEDPQVVAVKTDGTLWAWGANNYGQAGQGSTTTDGYSSPVQIGSLTTWKYLATPGNGVLASKTDGTLWAWGQNNVGQLGLGNTTNYSSPVQVGSLTNWGAITSGDKLMRAIKTDGTLWAWGYNYYGQVGNSASYPTAYPSSPVQIGSSTKWGKIMRGNMGSFTIALQFN